MMVLEKLSGNRNKSCLMELQKKVKEKIMKKEKIEIYGAGCDKYFETLNNMKKAVKNKNIAAEIVEITDGKKIAEMGIVNMPAVRVMGKIVSQGRAVSQAEAMQMLEMYIA